jgi:hypothetical protein
VKDTEIDQMLDKAADVPEPVPAALLKRVGDSIVPSLRPVRPLAPPWVLAMGLVSIGATIALSAAAIAGFQGFVALGPGARLLIFGTLLLLAGTAATQAVRQWIPGSPGRVAPSAMLAIVTAALLGVFALLFHDYRTEHFVAAGVACLITGLLYALPAALVGCWLLHRGYVVNAVAAGLVAGMLAGLTGVTLLELHCTNFEALHVLVWHTLVVPATAAVGAIVGWVVEGRAGWLTR